MARSKVSKKKSSSGMNRPLAFLGGLLVIISVGLSLVLDFFGWWNYSIILGHENWINAFGGLNWNDNIENLYSDDALIELMPGVIALFGAILILIRKQATGIIGALLVFVAIGIFINNLDTFVSLNLFLDLNNASIYWWNSGTFYCYMGYGLIMGGLGAVFGLIGSLLKN